MDLSLSKIYSSSVCPFTGLSITTLPEWTDLKIAKDYSVSYKLIGDSILCTILNGIASDLSTHRIIQTRAEFLRQAGLIGGQYAEIRDYGKFKGKPSKKSRMFLANMLLEETNNSNLKGFWIYNASVLINMAFNVGTKIYKTATPIRAVKDYEEAITSAVIEINKVKGTLSVENEEKNSITIDNNNDKNIDTQIKQFSDELLQFFGSINWDQPGITPENFGKNHPFQSVFEAVEIIKNDIDDLFNKQKKDQLKIRENEKKYRTIIETINDGYFEIDLKGYLTFVNGSMSDIFGYSKKELLKMNFKQFANDTTYKKVFNSLNNIFEKKDLNHKALDWKFIRKDGAKIYVETSISLIINKKNKTTGFRGLIRDITERVIAEKKKNAARKELVVLNKELENAIEKTNQMFVESAMAYLEIDQIFKASSEGIWVIDKTFKVLRVNTTFLSITNKTSDEIVGEKCHKIFANHRCHTKDCPLTRIMNNETNLIETDLEITGDDNATTPFMLSAHPYKNTTSETIGVVIGLRDITELKKAEKLHAEKIKAEADNTAKSNFLANVSHEIRTPLNGIIGMTELIENTNLDDNQKNIFDTISNEAKSLVKIISNVLDFSKIEAGKYDLEKIPFDLSRFVNDISNSIALRAQKKGLEFISFLSPDVPPLVIGDPGKLRQILMNLAGNSLKFTHEGEISLSIKIDNEDEENLKLLFSMSDTGIGIAKESQEKIFECFTQADESTTRQYGGTGLGTAISKQLVELMNGEIGIVSELGKGSEFWFTIELQKQETSGLEQKSSVELKDIKALIVDENNNYRSAQMEYLKAWGSIPSEADNGTEALSIYKNAVLSDSTPDLLLIVHPLPDMTGFELAEKIIEIKTEKKIPMIIITSVGWMGDGKRCKEIGIEGYLTKPVSSDDIQEAIKLVLNSSKNNQQPFELITKHSIAENAEIQTEQRHHDDYIESDSQQEQITNAVEFKTEKNSINILLVEDYPTNQQVAMAHLNNAGYNVNLAENGQVAVDEFKKSNYDIVLMDIQMPVMGGFEATKIIREYEKTVTKKENTPIIAMTAHAMDGYKQLCLDAEMSDYITKPLLRKSLLELITKWTSNKTTPLSAIDQTNEQDNRAQITEGDDELLDLPDGETPMDFDKALEEFMGKKEILTSVLETFLGNAKSQIDTLKKAVIDKNFEIIKQESHTIKGGAANLTANVLSKIASDIEVIGKNEDLNNADDLLTRFEAEYHRLETYLANKLNQ